MAALSNDLKSAIEARRRLIAKPFLVADERDPRGFSGRGGPVVRDAPEPSQADGARISATLRLNDAEPIISSGERIVVAPLSSG
jgi:hypothetical protein